MYREGRFDREKRDVSVMTTKNIAEVVIAGKVRKIIGYESPEYLHQIAVYINEKLSECQGTDGYRKQSTDERELLLNMNLADDFFKAREQADRLTAELEKKERELYGVRHDLIEAQLSIEKLQNELEDLKKEKHAPKGNPAVGTANRNTKQR